MVLKTTDPRARPAPHRFKTGYSEMAMPTDAAAAMSSNSAPAVTWFACAETLVR
jgi:hypothetical protein